MSRPACATRDCGHPWSDHEGESCTWFNCRCQEYSSSPTARPSLRDLLAAAVHQVRVDDRTPCYHGRQNGCEEVAELMLATPSGRALASHFEREAALVEDIAVMLWWYAGDGRGWDELPDVARAPHREEWRQVARSIVDGTNQVLAARAALDADGASE